MIVVSPSMDLNNTILTQKQSLNACKGDCDDWCNNCWSDDDCKKNYYCGYD